jgi:catechol 2,3-dioxygenase
VGTGERPLFDPAYGIAPPNYRLPEDTRLGWVKLQVASLGRSLDFYHRVIGLKVMESTGAWAALGARSDAGALVGLFERLDAAPVPSSGRLGLYHFALRLPDRAALARFIRHATEVGARMGMADHLVSEAVYLSDPDGHGIEVYADRPRSRWQRNGRQLVMGTEPLNVTTLMSPGHDGPFEGLPAGTVVGHVHLHVGDLAQATAFYHAALGFDKVVWDYPGALFLSAGGYHHHLGVNTWASEAPRAGSDDARLIAWTVIVPGPGAADRAADSIKTAGYVVSGQSGQWLVEDPWGTTVEISSPRSND